MQCNKKWLDEECPNKAPPQAKVLRTQENKNFNSL